MATKHTKHSNRSHSDDNRHKELKWNSIMIAAFLKKQYVPPKRRALCELRGITSLKTALYTLTGVRTSNIIQSFIFSFVLLVPHLLQWEPGRLDGQGSIPGRGKRVLLLHSIQTGSGAHPASYLMGAEGSFSGGKAARE
jgi:hypothetical protein